MSETILVIGATGNVGSTLVPLLAQKGIHVRAATRNPNDYPVQEHVQPLFFDYDDEATYETAVQGADRLFLLVKTADSDPTKTAGKLIDYAQRAGIKHIVLMTAFGVNYAGEELSMRRLELLLIKSGVPYTILRPGWFMQNFSKGFLYPMIANGGTIYLPAEEAQSALIDTRDIAEVAAIALISDAHYNKEYGLTGAETFSYGETATILSQHTGRTIQYQSIPETAFKQSLQDAGWQPDQIEFMATLFAGVREGQASMVTPELGNLLGRTPTPFNQFVQDHKQVWQN